MFISIRYYITKKKKSKPLNFDYYLIRMTFDKKTIEIKVFHERGPRHILPKDLTGFIINELNKNLATKLKKQI